MAGLRPEGMSYSRYTAVMGILFAAAAVLNVLDSVFSAFLPAGIRIGLSNIVIMTAMLSMGLPSAFLLTVLKVLLVLVTRGFTAGMMSLCGSLAAFAVTALLFGKTKASYILVSVLGAVCHSFGQLAAAALMMKTASVFAYGTLLTVSSVIAGVCTGTAMKIIMPNIIRIIPTKGKVHIQEERYE